MTTEILFVIVEKDVQIRLNLIRAIGEMVKKGIDIAKDVLKECGIPFFLDILNTKNLEVVNASSYIIQVSTYLRKFLKSGANFWGLSLFSGKYLEY